MTTTWEPAVHTPRHRASEVYELQVAIPAALARPGRHAAEDADGDLLDWLGFTADAC
jgi:hypothetical protein